MKNVFISYRRDDNPDATGRICDELRERFGPQSVFMDIDNIPFAIDFRDHVRETLKQSDIVLAVVGPRWRGAGEGRVRLEDEDDPVRAEIEIAMQAGIPIFPVLVDGAAMPQAPDFADLPAIAARWAEIERATQTFVAGLGDADVARVIEYTNFQGERWAYPLWQQMMHQVNHATQHRSEAAVILTGLGSSPGGLDLLYFADEQEIGRAHV